MPNSSKTTLTQWAIFNAVVENGGYLKAAEKLNRSHSSLHHAVRKLQQSLGVELIQVRGKTPHLTPIGEVMQRRSLQLLKDASELEKLAEQMGEGWEPQITLAVETIFPNTALMPVLDLFHKTNQITRLKIVDVILNKSVEMIENAAADVAISAIVPLGYLGTPLTHIIMHPYAHKDHPLITLNRPVTQQDLISYLQIVISDNAKQPSGRTIGWLRAEQRWTVSDFHYALDILKSGQGFCWMPEHFPREAVEKGILRKIEIRDDLAQSATLYLIVPKRETLGPGAELLAKLIREEGKKFLPPLPNHLG